MVNKFVENVTCRDMGIYGTITDHTPYYIPDDKRFMDGVVRTSRGGLEYYDAEVGDWFPLPGSEVNLEIAPHIKVVLDWAYYKMEEERKLGALVAKYPALKQAKENYDIIKAMVQNETT